MLVNISIEEFKSIEGTQSVNIIRNPNTAKLFVQAGTGQKFKVQGKAAKAGELNIGEPISFMIDVPTTKVGDKEVPIMPTSREDIKDGCFVNNTSDNLILAL